MRLEIAAPIACLIVMHSPDGAQLRFEARNLTAVRQLPPNYKEHVAHGTKTIVYGSGGNKFGVIETPEQITDMAKACGDDRSLQFDGATYGKR